MTGVILRYSEGFERALRKFAENAGTTPVPKTRTLKPKVRRKLLSNVYG